MVLAAPSSEGGVGIPPGQAGTADATKSATQPASTPPTTASKTQVATPDQPNSAAVASAKKPISGSQKPDAATGTIPVRFQPGSSSVTAPDSAAVDAILTYLSAHPTSKATVSGYASSEGDLATNAALAKERADAFKAYLVGRGVTAERVIAVGRGIERPIASNDSQQGRAKNRRVEVNFYSGGDWPTRRRAELFSSVGHASWPMRRRTVGLSQKSTPPTFATIPTNPSAGTWRTASTLGWLPFPDALRGASRWHTLRALPPAMLNDVGAGCRGWQHDLEACYTETTKSGKPGIADNPTNPRRGVEYGRLEDVAARSSIG